ncbi:hypothetical protein [Streptomyces sp. NPDC048295]
MNTVVEVEQLLAGEWESANADAEGEFDNLDVVNETNPGHNGGGGC